MPMTVEYRNGVHSSTISYSNMVIPEGITNNNIYLNHSAAGARGLGIISTGDNHVTCGQLSKPDVATLSYRRSHY